MLKGIGAAVENIHHESSQTPSVTTSPAHPPRSRLSRITTSYHGISSRHNSQKAQMPSMFFVERFPCFPVYQTAHQTAPELLQSGHRSERSRHHQTWFDRWITQENASVTKLVGDVSRCIQNPDVIFPQMDHGQLLPRSCHSTNLRESRKWEGLCSPNVPQMHKIAQLNPNPGKPQTTKIRPA